MRSEVLLVGGSGDVDEVCLFAAQPERAEAASSQLQTHNESATATQQQTHAALERAQREAQQSAAQTARVEESLRNLRDEAGPHPSDIPCPRAEPNLVRTGVMSETRGDARESSPLRTTHARCASVTRTSSAT